MATTTDPATGDEVALHELASRYGLNPSTVRGRYWKGWRGWELVAPPVTWQAWTTRELAYLDTHYPAGKPVAEIADVLGRSSYAVIARAAERGLRHPSWCSAQAIRNFESAHGQPLADIARVYRSRRLSRTALAHDIGIEIKALREAVGEALWRSWPRMTIGRIDANRERRKAA